MLALARRENKEGHYDIHTNTIQWPRAMQPTHARWETIEWEGVDGEEDGQKQLSNGIHGAEQDVEREHTSIFKELSPVYPRNFMISDLCLEGAPESKFGSPGLDNDPQSLSNIPHDVLDELPAECRQAFEEARSREMSWRSKWSTEGRDGNRARFMPTVEWFP